MEFNWQIQEDKIITGLLELSREDLADLEIPDDKVDLVNRNLGVLSQRHLFPETKDIFELQKLLGTVQVKILSYYVEQRNLKGMVDVIGYKTFSQIDYDNAVMCAAGLGLSKFVFLLIRLGANRELALSKAALRGHESIVEQLLIDGLSIIPALTGAIQGGHTEMVENILSRIPDLDPKEFDYYNAGLTSAAYSGNLTIVKLMIAYGADDYNFALIRSVSGGHGEIVKMILNAGANNYDKAINMAITLKRFDIAQIIIDHKDRTKT